MDFRDAPQEAEFRSRLRAWLAETAGQFPTSGDDYWARQGEWHRALYAAGFFGASSIERLATEPAIEEQARKFKAITLRS